jgi:hypothetical protein
MTAHSALTGTDLHEPKGIASASVNTGYFADGAGSGTWQKVTASNIDTTSIKNINQRYYTLTIPDICTADRILFPVPESSSLTSVRGVISAAITVANCGLTLTKNGGTTLGTGTVLFTGSAKGDTYVMTPSANSLVANDYIEIVTDGAGTGPASATFILLFSVT